MEKQSWSCTVITQLTLFFAVFIAFNIGGSQRSIRTEAKGRLLDLYFLSVSSGHRSHKQQSHLLKQFSSLVKMDKVAKLCDVKFVVNISELGDDDPLYQNQNGTLQFSSLKVPWYNTNASKGPKRRYFLKQIPLQYGQIFDIIVVDTESLKELNGSGADQLHWLTKLQENMDAKWRIAIGLDPLLVCEENEEVKEAQLFEPLHSIFLKLGVNAYLSKQGCATLYTHKVGIAYIGNPGPSNEGSYKASSKVGTSISSSYGRELRHGFFLHRVSALEIVSYFINPANEIELRLVLHQHGKEFM